VTRAGLYIHVPFCASVCPYCDFAVTIAGEERRTAYVDGIAAEAAGVDPAGLEFDTVYLGGGTPSSLRPEQLLRVLESVRRRFVVTPDATISLEANPEDVTREAAAVWTELGVEFASLGVQAFDDETLRSLGRRHTANAAREAIEILQDSGFTTVSIDLIYGHEGQSEAVWRAQLEEAATRAVDHLSCYQLTYHEGTVFGRRLASGDLREAPEPRQAELFLLTHTVLAELGYQGYEVSNFATAAGHRSRHNRKYWRHTPYLGLGPSAHSFDGRRRWWNHRKLRIWQREVDRRRAPVEGSERLTPAQLAFEAVMLGLRTADGVDLDLVRTRHGIDLQRPNRGVLERLCASGHLVLEGAVVRPTLPGMAIADTLARSFEIPSETVEGRTALRSSDDGALW
jgi:oxygen-independent coproporphyrinogen-3 oxidase